MRNSALFVSDIGHLVLSEQYKSASGVLLHQLVAQFFFPFSFHFNFFFVPPRFFSISFAFHFVPSFGKCMYVRAIIIISRNSIMGPTWRHCALPSMFDRTYSNDERQTCIHNIIYVPLANKWSIHYINKPRHLLGPYEYVRRCRRERQRAIRILACCSLHTLIRLSIHHFKLILDILTHVFL